MDRDRAGNLLEIAGTHIDFTGRIALTGAWDRVSGTAQAAWRRENETLLFARAHLAQSEPDEAEEVVSFSAELLPESPGDRKARGEIRLPQWSRWKEASFRLARVEAHAPDLRAALEELALRWPGVIPDLPQNMELAGPLSLDAAVTGQLLSPRADARALWLPPRGGAVRLNALGAPLGLDGALTVEVQNAAMEDLVAELSGRVDGELKIRRSQDDLTGELVADIHNLCPGQGLPMMQAIHAEASLEDGVVRLPDLSLWWEERIVHGQGRILLHNPIEQAELSLDLWNPAPGVPSATLLAALSEGRLTVKAPWVDTALGPAHGQVVLPLVALEAEPRLADLLTLLPLATASGPVELEAEIGPLDGEGVPLLLSPDRGALTLEGHAAVKVALDPHAMTMGKGEIRLEGIRAELDDHWLQMTEPLVASLRDGRVTLPLTRLEAHGQPMEISGAVLLDDSWRPGASLVDLVESLWLNGHGAIDASLASAFSPALAGDGPVKIDVQIEGPLDDLSGHGRIDGREARLILYEPYYSRLEDLHVELELGQGEILVHSAEARLNDGQIDAGGWVGFDGTADVGITLDGVHYVLDHGLTTILSGDLRLVLREWLRGELSGRTVVERGLLRREMDVDREILAAILEAPGLEGTEESLLEHLALDLTISTWDGVRIRNNVADLHASWDPIQVSGSAADPVVEGIIEVDPGGLVYAYGQTVRLDKASLVYSGVPGADATLEIETTSSLVDPTVGEERRSSVVVRPPAPGYFDDRITQKEAVARGIAAHFGDAVARQLTQGVLDTTISFSTEPLVLFGRRRPMDGSLLPRTSHPRWPWRYP